MKKHTLRLVAASLLAVMGHLPAHAGNVAFVNSALWNVQYHLVDLDTSDGVTPWVSFGSPAGTVASGYATSPFGDNLLFTQQTPGGLFSGGTFNAGTDDGVLKARRDSQGIGVTVNVPTEALTGPDSLKGSSVQYGRSVNVLPDFSTPFAFTLSPKTQLVIDGMVASEIHFNLAEVMGSPLKNLLDQGGVLDVRLSGNAGVFLEYDRPDAEPGQAPYVNAGDSSFVTLDYLIGKDGVIRASGTPETAHDVHALSVVLDNPYAQAISGTYVYSAGASIAVAGGVPEPSTWALMGLGLAGLAFARARRPSSR